MLRVLLVLAEAFVIFVVLGHAENYNSQHQQVQADVEILEHTD